MMTSWIISSTYLNSEQAFERCARTDEYWLTISRSLLLHPHSLPLFLELHLDTSAKTPCHSSPSPKRCEKKFSIARIASRLSPPQSFRQRTLPSHGNVQTTQPTNPLTTPLPHRTPLKSHLPANTAAVDDTKLLTAYLRRFPIKVTR